MPIRPENKARYPADWIIIRATILERAGHKCEGCGVPNHWLITRNPDGTWNDAGRGRHSGHPHHAPMWDGRKVIRVVLTIGHLDHTPENCAESNLKSWCQACHNRYDAAHRRETRAATRAAKLNGAQRALPLGGLPR
jgi:hypothetical protein